jgi:heat shock protein HslJ
MPRGWVIVGLGLMSSLAAADTIEGPLWRVTRLRGVDEKALTAITAGVTVRLEQGRLQGFGGCNRLGGSYTIEGDRLGIGPLAGTMMACPEPAMTIETAFKKALAGTLRFRVDQEGLTLTPETETEPVLIFAAAVPPRLEGVRWEVTGYNNGRHAVVGPLTGTVLTVIFDAGTIVGVAGCNRFRAAYRRDGDRLTVGPPAATRKQCGDEVMDQERQFLAAIQSATTWAIDNGTLDLHRADGERVLHARPAGTP